MIDIKKELEPKWAEIVRAENRCSQQNIGTTLQDDLHETIRPLLPNGIGYFFDFNMSGQTQHIFYEIANPNNKYTP